MKKIPLALLLSFFLQVTAAQVLYYKGEWTKANKQDLFRGIFKIHFDKHSNVTGKLIWIYMAIDSTDNNQLEQYRGKKGKAGIEYVEGTYNAATNDLNFAGKRKYDPDSVIGLDKYNLKLSANKQVIYGKTDSNGANDGLFYAVKLNNSTGAKAFAAARRKVHVKKKH